MMLALRIHDKRLLKIVALGFLLFLGAFVFSPTVSAHSNRNMDDSFDIYADVPDREAAIDKCPSHSIGKQTLNWVWADTPGTYITIPQGTSSVRVDILSEAWICANASYNHVDNYYKNFYTSDSRVNFGFGDEFPARWGFPDIYHGRVNKGTLDRERRSVTINTSGLRAAGVTQGICFNWVGWGQYSDGWDRTDGNPSVSGQQDSTFCIDFYVTNPVPKPPVYWLLKAEWRSGSTSTNPFTTRIYPQSTITLKYGYKTSAYYPSGNPSAARGRLSKTPLTVDKIFSGGSGSFLENIDAKDSTETYSSNAVVKSGVSHADRLCFKSEVNNWYGRSSPTRATLNSEYNSAASPDPRCYDVYNKRFGIQYPTVSAPSTVIAGETFPITYKICNTDTAYAKFSFANATHDSTASGKVTYEIDVAPPLVRVSGDPLKGNVSVRTKNSCFDRVVNYKVVGGSPGMYLCTVITVDGTRGFSDGHLVTGVRKGQSNCSDYPCTVDCDPCIPGTANCPDPCTPGDPDCPEPCTPGDPKCPPPCLPPAPACPPPGILLVGEPFVRFKGSDIWAGGYFANDNVSGDLGSQTCDLTKYQPDLLTRAKGAYISGLKAASGTQFLGASAQYAATALSKIGQLVQPDDTSTGFGTANFTSNTNGFTVGKGKPGHRLSFASITSGGSGKFYGDAPSNDDPRCIRDYYSYMDNIKNVLGDEVRVEENVLPGAVYPMLVGLEENEKLIITTSGSPTIGALTIPKGANVVLLADDHRVVINGNIEYAGYTNVSEIPSFTVITRNNIDIMRNTSDPQVTRLDGLYIAQTDSAVATSLEGGIIRTCMTGNIGTDKIHNSTGNDLKVGEQNIFGLTNKHKCAADLEVNGAFIARRVDFLRSGGGIDELSESFGTNTHLNINSSQQDSSAAELFLFSPEMYLSSPFVTSGKTFQIKQIKELPPVR